MISSILPVLLLVSALVTFRVDAQRTCRRRAPPFTDCSSTTGECNLLFDANNLPSMLPFPPPNTRTCYRTCHDSDGQCRSVPTVVNEQKLAVQSTTANSRVLRIFSPNYAGGSYRKSTNCRYRVQCDPGQVLSYSVLDFDLEEKNTCSSGSECLDYVEINYQNLATRQRFCGSGESGEIHIVGSNELTFEFVSNRRTEKRGFVFFVNCIDPVSDRNAAAPAPQPPSLGFVPSANIIGTNPCTEPPNMAPRPLPFEITSGIIPTISVRKYVVQMFGSIFYKSGCILVRNAKGVTENTIRGIFRLEVTNRFTTSVRHFNPVSQGLTFNGYGILEISEGNAIFYQQGADPMLQPTPEESSTIIELERAINSIIGDDFFDVQDQYDTPAWDPDIQPFLDQRILQEPQQPVPWDRIPRQALHRPLDIPDRASELANQYSNACNAILRSTACAYQALLLGTDCNTGLSLS